VKWSGNIDEGPLSGSGGGHVAGQRRGGLVKRWQGGPLGGA
jgi:hypothetical protein